MNEPRATADKPAKPQPAAPAGGGRGEAAANRYRDRPSEDGKRGDGADEPNAGFPHND